MKANTFATTLMHNLVKYMHCKLSYDHLHAAEALKKWPKNRILGAINYYKYHKNNLSCQNHVFLVRV